MTGFWLRRERGLFAAAVRLRKAGLKWPLNMPNRTIVLIVQILLLIGASPAWPHSKSWGYYSSGGLGQVAVFVPILVLISRI